MAGKKCPKCNKRTFFVNGKNGECKKCGYKMQVQENENKSGNGKIFYAIGSSVIFGVTCFAFPKLARKVINKAYKASVKKKNEKR